MDDVDITCAYQVHSARIKVSNSVFERKLLSAIPNVEVLELQSWNMDEWFVDVPIAGHRLRSLDISRNSDSISLAAFLNLLDRAPLLETVNFSVISFTPSVGTLRAVTHMLLSTFHLSYVTEAEDDAIFGDLTLPALRSLSFGGLDQPWPRPNNLSFLQRSGCMLTTLAFRGCIVDEEGLVTLLWLRANSPPSSSTCSLMAKEAVHPFQCQSWNFYL